MRQLASSWNVLPTQSLARVRVTGFYQVEFIDCLSSVNVCLNWKKMAAERWPVSIEEINSEPELHALYIPKYMLHGRLVPYDTPGASPLRVGKAKTSVRQWPPCGQTLVYRYEATFLACHAPVEMMFPAYLLPNSERLLLDGIHRAVALVLSGVPFTLKVLSINGPIDVGALPDLMHWQ